MAEQRAAEVLSMAATKIAASENVREAKRVTTHAQLKMVSLIDEIGVDAVHKAQWMFNAHQGNGIDCTPGGFVMAYNIDSSAKVVSEAFDVNRLYAGTTFVELTPEQVAQSMLAKSSRKKILSQLSEAGVKIDNSAMIDSYAGVFEAEKKTPHEIVKTMFIVVRAVDPSLNKYVKESIEQADRTKTVSEWFMSSSSLRHKARAAQSIARVLTIEKIATALNVPNLSVDEIMHELENESSDSTMHDNVCDTVYEDSSSHIVYTNDAVPLYETTTSKGRVLVTQSLRTGHALLTYNARSASMPAPVAIPSTVGLCAPVTSRTFENQTKFDGVAEKLQRTVCITSSSVEHPLLKRHAFNARSKAWQAEQEACGFPVSTEVDLRPVAVVFPSPQ